MGVADYFGNPSSAAGTLGGQFSTSPAGVAVNDGSGDVYVVDSGNHRVQQFDSDGGFVRAWGINVSSAAANEMQAVMVNATAGQFRLTFGGDTTGDLAAGVPASGGVGPFASVENALNALPSVSTFGGLVSVSGGPGNAGGTTPYLVTFRGTLGETDVAAMTADPGTVPLSGGAGVGADAATVSTFAAGGASTTSFEVCETAANCQAGTTAATGGGLSTPRGVAVNQQTGDVYVTSQGLRRVSQFDAEGNFIRSWGQDVVATGSPHNVGTANFEICTAADVCKIGVAGATGGAFGGLFGADVFIGHLAVAPTGAPNAGNVVVADPANRRVQEFTAVGAFVRAFGFDVVSGNAPIGFEVCLPADVCKVGVAGAGSGQFSARSPARVAVDASGAIYTVEAPNTIGSSNHRVQKFPHGGAPEAFAPDILTAPGVQTEGPANSPIAVAVDPVEGHVYVAKGSGTGSGQNAVGVETQILELDGSGALVDTHMAGSGVNPVSGSVPVHDLAVKAGGVPAYVTSVTVAPRVYVVDEVPEPSVVVGEATGVTNDSAVLHAAVTPSQNAAGFDTLYRFEYSKNGFDWVRATQSDVDLGNGSGSGDPGLCPAGDPPVCEVSQQISGLDAGEEYQVRVIARTEFGGASVTVEGDPFTTPVAPPVSRTGPAMWSSPAETSPSLLLTGEVEPRNAETTYVFEYVDEQAFAESGFDTAASFPATPADAGAGLRPVAVRQAVTGLDPTVAYRYRLVATNGEGATAGAARSIAPPDDSDRFYEWVSDGDSWGSGIRQIPVVVGTGGDRAQFFAQAIGSTQSLPGPNSPYTSVRGGSGWDVRHALPAKDVAQGSGFGNTFLTSLDLGSVLWPEANLAQRLRGEVQWMRVGLDGDRTPVSGPLARLDRTGDAAALGTEYILNGGSEDLSTFTFWFYAPDLGASGKFFPDEPVYPIYRSGLYQYSADGEGGSVMSLVNRATDPEPGVSGEVIGGVCGAWLAGAQRASAGAREVGPHRAVSADGSVVYFGAAPDSPATGGSCPGGPERVYKRIDNSTTVEVSQSQCVRVSPVCETAGGHDIYQGASVDGSVAVFKSTRQLTDSDIDTGSSAVCDNGSFLSTGCDIYVYDADPPAGQPNLVQASAGEAVPGHDVGSGAQVADVIDFSADGSRVYFTARGVLTGANRRGDSPAAFLLNLYVFERDETHPAGRIEFVAPTSIGDLVDGSTRRAAALPSGADGDGRLLVFATSAAMLPEDGDGSQDVYRYDDVSGAVECLSCAGDGAFDARIANRTRFANPDNDLGSPFASADASTVVFTSSEQLDPADENSVNDVYVWRDGQGLRLVSGGTGPFGTGDGANTAGVSPDGDSVFFQTQAGLDASDVNNQWDLYVARVGGGFPAQPAPPEKCAALGDGCQGPGATPTGSQSQTSSPPSGGNADVGERVRLALKGPGLAARRRAARTGVLAIRVRSSRAGTVRVIARAKIGKRVRRVGRASKQLRSARTATIKLRLSAVARRRLRGGRPMAVVVRVRSGDARMRSLTVRLPGARS